MTKPFGMVDAVLCGLDVVPLLLIGPGKLSADAVIRSCFASS